MEHISINTKDIEKIEKRINISKNISNQIDALDVFENAHLLVMSLIQEDANLTSLSDEHIKTLLWLSTKIPKENRSYDIIAKATLIGLENIKNVISDISTLLRIENEKIYAQIRETPKVLLVSSIHANNVCNYLRNIGLSSQQLREVFFEAALLDEKTLKERCEAVLKYWNVDGLVYLVERNIFGDLPYYDPVEAISVAVNTLGSKRAMEFFNSYPAFFITYRSKEYRWLSSDVMLYEESLKALEIFKNTI